MDITTKKIDRHASEHILNLSEYKEIRQNTHRKMPVPRIKYMGIFVSAPMKIPHISKRVTNTIGRRINYSLYIFVC